ncbi:MAG: DNA translocase FtsK [Victivallales bacterium]|nr:DNA translocase FtsK [Victivallales bacterium]
MSQAPIEKPLPKTASETPRKPAQTEKASSESPVKTSPQPANQAAKLTKLEEMFLAKQGAREARQQRHQRGKDSASRQSALHGEAAAAPLQLELPLNTPVAEPTDVAPVSVSNPPPTPPAPTFENYTLPSPDLLIQEDTRCQEDEQEIAKQKKAIQDTLDSFYIDAEVTNHKRGPRITLFEVHVAQGVKVTSIANVHNDLAMALAANSLRILAPMPGHDYVGIEVPNATTDVVRTGASITSPSFTKSKGLLPVILGRNVEGEDVVVDLAKCPHLLVAGATGSGKSVCLNNIIISLLYRFTPDDLKLILVDPKVVEMSVYNTIPHLLIPVITDVDLVVLALHWAIDEMQRRYKLMAKVGVRNLEDFNRRPPEAEPVLDDTGEAIPPKLPFIVIIIDELADIMLTARQDVESCLARIAQLSRAVGIHCIVATQRPSVNVITGVIKANFPTRIAFQVSSQVDSRTIIDGKGAEALLGRGDMLFKSANAFRMQRLQGAMLTDQEIDNVVKACSAQGPHAEDYKLIQTASKSIGAGDDDSEGAELGDSGDDQAGESLVRAAIEIVIRDQKASISYIQRRLKIGYNTAASLIETLEKRGIVGPQIGSAPREIIAQSIEEAIQDEDL